MKNYVLILVFFITAFISCTENKEHSIKKKIVKKAIGKPVTDSIAPPIITPIVPAKAVSVTITSRPFSFDPRMGKEAITTITPANGLPLGLFYSGFVQDITGNLWFTNRTNIIKYDGHTFISYPLIPGDNVRCTNIALDSNNELWAAIVKPDSTGTSDVANLYVFNGISFEPLPGMQSAFKNKNRIFSIGLFPQHDGTIWVVADNRNQILKFKGRDIQKTITQNDFPHKWISDIKTDRQGNTWFTDRSDSTLTQYDGKTFKTLTSADGLPKTTLSNTFPFSADSIHIQTSIDGSFLFDGQKSIRVKWRPLLLDKQGTLWSDSSAEVNKRSVAGIININREDGLSITRSWDLGLDNEDNVWVLLENSLNQLYKPVTTYEDVLPTPMRRYGFRALHNDSHGNYWLGSITSGIGYYNGKTLTHYSFPNNGATNPFSSDNNIGAITEDKAGNLWFGTWGGSLIKYDGKSFFNYNKSNGLAIGAIGLVLMADSKGNIWFSKKFGPIQNGAAYFNGKELVSFSTAQGLCNNTVNSICEDSAGTMWFGTDNGLSRFKNGRFTTFNENDGLSSSRINAITGDKNGNLWLATDVGVSRFDGAQFINYTTENGILAGNINVIKMDTVNNLLWMVTDVGFTAMSIKANHPDSVTFENYSEAEGFPVKGVNDFMIDSTGAILTSEGRNSIKRVDYKKVKENSKPFNLHIAQIRLNNEAICWSHLKDGGKDSVVLQMEMQLRFGKLLSSDVLEQMAKQFNGVRYDSIIPFDFIPYNLSLPYKANSISFDFAAIDPHFSKSTRYKYMLEGFDKTWSPLGKNTNANFGNLWEDSYTFKLKALNPYGIWSEMRYSFKVLPPWYRTWWAYAGYGLIFLFIIWRVHLYQQKITIRRERERTQQKELEQAKEIEKAYQELKSTQQQLIQSEKMASLGELTAGIAHEIQNPLNFVNNFSEVNTELIKEIQDERRKTQDKRDEKLEDDLLQDIVQNQEKINQHGKRAADIVKGMLQHSRSSSGVKEPTDINALADEYLRLAYHGLRAKDKSFNATMKTDFDKSIGNINIIPQDIGRVILNLINNAFYAVNEKARQNITEYEPTVSVSTKKEGNKVLISVKDNGNGIPDKIKEKIFQPFFTTKPTGQGTGLGLSLSYDIVKAHGGAIEVISTEGTGSNFLLTLPA